MRNEAFRFSLFIVGVAATLVGAIYATQPMNAPSEIATTIVFKIGFSILGVAVLNELVIWWNKHRKVPKKSSEEKEFERELNPLTTSNDDGTDPVHHNFTSAWDALDRYLKTVQQVGHGALAENAIEIRRSMSTLVREYISLRTAYRTTSSDLKKKMYSSEMTEIRRHLNGVSGLFSTAHLELKKELEERVVAQGTDALTREIGHQTEVKKLPQRSYRQT